MTHRVKFKVESASIANGFTLAVAAPQSRRRGAAVGAVQAGSPTPCAARLVFHQSKRN